MGDEQSDTIKERQTQDKEADEEMTDEEDHSDEEIDWG